MMTAEFKTFMNNLYGSEGTIIPDLGVIESVRCMYGTDLEAVIQTSDNDLILREGTRLYQEYPNLFEGKG